MLPRGVIGWLVGALLASATPVFGADTVTQCINANEDSLSLRKEGKLLEARRALSACAASTCPDAIEQACRGRIPELNGAIPSVVFDVKDASGRDVLAAQVSVDGQPAVAVGLTAMALDPGPHVLRFQASGQPAVESHVVLREGQKDQRIAVVLGAAAASDVKAPAPQQAPSEANVPVTSGRAPATAPAPPVPSAESPAAAGAFGAAAGPAPPAGSGPRTAGWILGGVGIATLGAGAALAWVAKSSYDGAAGCSGSVCTSEAGYTTRNSARTLGDVATGVFVAGGALTAAGVVVWIAAPSGRRAAGTPSWGVALVPGGALAEGRF